MYKERACLLTLVVLTTLAWVSGTEAPVEMKKENEVKQEESNEKDKTETQTIFSNSNEEPEIVEGTEENEIVEEILSARTVLDSTNFEKTVKHGYTFVKFYAPWCGHCVQMAPDWNDLANHFFKNPIAGVDLTIAEVDCTESSMTCLDEGVDGYPSIKLYKDGSLVQDYFFARSLDRMKRFLAEKLIDIEKIEPNSIGVYALNDLIFNTFIEKSGDVPVIVKFYVPWCTHCQEFQEVYDELVIKFLMEESEDIKFAEVNCMDMDSLETCTEEGVEGYPAVHLYKEGVIEDVFDDTRTVDALSNFIWQTVDPSRVESNNEMDDFLNLASLMGGMAGGEEEFEECDCSEPDCECEEEEDEEELEDEEYEEEDEFEEVDEEDLVDEEDEEEDVDENEEMSSDEDMEDAIKEDDKIGKKEQTEETEKSKDDIKESLKDKSTESNTESKTDSKKDEL